MLRKECYDFKTIVYSKRIIDESGDIKMKKRRIGLLALLLLSIMMFSLSAQAAKIKLNKTKASIKVGKTVKLKVKGTSKKVKWVSSNKKVATVTSKGKVKGKKAGTAIITAKVAGKKLKCKITVKKISYTVKERMAGIYIAYLKRQALIDPSSLEVIAVWDAYNNVRQENGSIEHHEFAIVEYLAKNRLGGKVRSYASLLLTNEYVTASSTLNVSSEKFTEGKYLYYYDSQSYPSPTRRKYLNVNKALKYSKTVSYF